MESDKVVICFEWFRARRCEPHSSFGPFIQDERSCGNWVCLKLTFKSVSELLFDADIYVQIWIIRDQHPDNKCSSVCWGGKFEGNTADGRIKQNSSGT